VRSLPPLTPLVPLFRGARKTGAIAVGNTPPPFVADYDYVIINDIGVIWYSIVSPVGAENPPIWLTYTQAIANDAYWTGWGTPFVEAWTNEYTGMEWPTIAQGIIDDATRYLGPYWTEAWWNQATKPTYEELVEDYMGGIWFSTVSTSVQSSPPIGGRISVIGLYTYHEFSLDTDGTNFERGSVASLSTDVMLVGGGGSGGGGNTNQQAGGGGGGNALVTTGHMVSATATVVRGLGGAIPATTSQGNNGESTTFDSLTGVGGSGGGRGNGSDGTTNTIGGGGGSDATTAGAGGIGTIRTGGTGVASATAATRRGGGGSGSGANGNGGTTPTGGAGTEWPSSSGNFYGGGGGGSAQGGANYAGGSGGGGGSSNGANFAGAPGTGGLGGGGGGGSNGFPAGAGGTGRVMVRYLT